MKVDYKSMVNLIKQNVLEVDPTVQVWLYGSRAKGNAREDSDWHTRHSVTPFYKSVQSEAVLL